MLVLSEVVLVELTNKVLTTEICDPIEAVTDVFDKIVGGEGSDIDTCIRAYMYVRTSEARNGVTNVASMPTETMA